MHAPELPYALKEIDGAALVVCQTAQQIVQILGCMIKGELSAPLP